MEIGYDQNSRPVFATKSSKIEESRVRVIVAARREERPRAYIAKKRSKR